MKSIFSLLLMFVFLISNSQTINLNESFLTDHLRTMQLLGKLESEISFAQRPINIGKSGLKINSKVFNNKKYVF